MLPPTRVAIVVCLAVFLGPGAAEAQPAANDARLGGPAAARGPDDLALRQQQLADKFTRLQGVLLRMAELTAATDPRRAALLKKVVAQSENRLVGVQFETLVELLAKESLSRAIDNQKNVETDLRALLDLLLSENRARRLESEKARIRDYLKKVNNLIKRQKGIQGRTAGGGEPEPLAEEQEKLAGSTGDLARDMKQNEEPADTRAEEDAGKAEEKERPGKDSSQGEDSSQGKEQAEGEKGPEDAKETPGQDRPPGKPQSGDPAEGSPSGQPREQDENPTRSRVEAAQRRMQQAQERLEEAQRDEAVGEQEEAIRQLEQAKADLEEILRQLREEEIERALAALAARFAKMLHLQQAVYDETLRLAKVPGPERDHNHDIEAGRLSGKEAEIVLEATKALALLRDDGSAVALPEAVDQMRSDMEQVVQRLARAKVGEITQAIEEDILAALEEMIEALQKAIEDSEQRKQRQPGQPPGGPQEPPLVDLMAEIKMIRALQMRVNRRTQRYSELIEGEQADTAELLDALRRLADRQERVHQVTRDLEMGKNR